MGLVIRPYKYIYTIFGQNQVFLPLVVHLYIGLNRYHHFTTRIKLKTGVQFHCVRKKGKTCSTGCRTHMTG